MQNSLRVRIGATLAAAALVAGGALFTSASASATDLVPENSELTPQLAALGTEALTATGNTTFAAGNWGEGLSLTLAGFPASTAVTIQTGEVSLTAPAGEGWGSTQVTTDASGAATVTNWIPEGGPNEFDAAASKAVVNAVYGDTSIPEGYVFVQGFDLTITPFVANAPAMTVTPTCQSGDTISVDGYDVYGTGFAPYELVASSTAFPDGTQYGESTTLTADASGTVTAHYTLTSTVNGVPVTVENGIYMEYLLGANGLGLEAAITVGDCAAPAAAEAPAAPQLANTGADMTSTFAGAGAILALGAIALFFVRRRQVAAE